MRQRGAGPTPRGAQPNSRVIDAGGVELWGLLENAAATLPALPFEAWHFGDSIAFEAMVSASRYLHEPALTNFARGFVRGWAATKREFRPTDCTAPGLAICHLYEQTGDRAILDVAIDLANYLATRRLIGSVFNTWEVSPLRVPYGPDSLSPEDEALRRDPGAGVFVDCLHFDPPFFASLGRIMDDDSWTQLAIQQANGYIRLLQNPTSGLFDHFYLEKTGNSYISGWGRGQGWALLGLLDVIEEVGASGDTDAIRTAARKLTLIMLKMQNPDGSWYAIVTTQQSGSESSTSAFMAVGFWKAVELGVVSVSEVHDAVQRAERSMLDNTSEAGVLTDVSAAVWASTLTTHYHHVPKGVIAPWGQGPLVLALIDSVAQAERGC